MLLRVYGRFMEVLLYPWHSKKPFRLLMDVDKAPLGLQLYMIMFLCRRDFNRIVEFFPHSVPRHAANRRAREDKPEQPRLCKVPSETLNSLEVVPH